LQIQLNETTIKNKNYTNHTERVVSVDKVKPKDGDMPEMRTETDETHLK
jgi:hypothetical protein